MKKKNKGIKENTDKLKKYLKKDLMNGSYEMGNIVRSISNVVGILRVREEEVIDLTAQPLKEEKFIDELDALLDDKLSTMDNVKISDPVFSVMKKELYDFMLCSLASERTPDEIVEGLDSDKEMKDEVVAMLVTKVEKKTWKKNQKIFFDRMLSGDDDLKALLNAQEEKTGFPLEI